MHRFVAAAVIVVAGLLFGSLAPTVANAQSTNTSTDGTGLILCGLWAGANLDLLSGLQCTSNTNTGTPRPSTTPAPTPMPPKASASYVALGDSVAAGLGLPMSLNASAQDTQCGRSPEAYPNIVASRLNLNLTNVACSGATAGDLFTQQRISGPNPPAQLSQAFAGGTPQLMTITTGANDAHWAALIRACYATDCTGSVYATLARAYLLSMQTKLSIGLSSLQARSKGSPPEVLITGYYDPLSANCSNQVPRVTPAEITWLRNETTNLNQTIQNVASQFSFAKFVPISFDGHDICSSSPWVQDINASAPFHPTDRGQQAIADAVVQAY